MPRLINNSIVKTAALLLPLLIGLSLLAQDYLEYQQGLSSLNWISAKGKMLHNSITCQRSLKNGRMIFIPTAEYSYHINDDVYRGYRMSFPNQIPSSETDLRKLLEKLEVGREITAFYDPADKSHVTLIRGVRHSKYLMLFLRDAAIAAVFVPMLYAIYLFSRKQKL